MTLPNFLVIGAQRAGTSALHERLTRHPQVFLPRARKELHFFDHSYDKGLEWYGKFFPSEQEARNYRAIGEVTPNYLYHPEVPERIEKTLGTVPLIAILRNPVERAYSQYGLWVRDNAIRMSFEDFLEWNDNVFTRGLYSEQLTRYLDRWPRLQILILIFESMIESPLTSFAQIAAFLDIHPQTQPEAEVEPSSNPSYRPRHPRLRSAAQSTARWLRGHDYDWPVNLAKRVGAAHWFGSQGRLPPMQRSIRQHLYRRYRPDIERTERLLGTEIPAWHPH